ncbi:MAG: LuxR C-terminal-related transcriptional regulator [Bacteroidia bacterium]|nr:LuxR C-terminal-related transcriptional regulator [Bacteroidia bacterium]
MYQSQPNVPETTPGLEDYWRMEGYYNLVTRTVTAVSSNWSALTGQDVNFLVGRSDVELLSLLPAEDQSVVIALFQESFAFLRNLPYGSVLTARVSVILRMVNTRSNQTKWIRLALRPQPNEYGMIGTLRIDVYDITDEDTHQVLRASVAYVDAFGQTAYHRLNKQQSVTEMLSPREIDILKLMLEGKTSKEIGANLKISKDTVDKARKTMLVKTGCKNSVELVSRYMNP